MAEDTDIAVVGIGCRFPGADNLKEFWRVLVNGENHVVDIPPERMDMDRWYDPDQNAPGKSYVKKAGLVKRLEYWDNNFFGINDFEAMAMDPQQRLVLDCVHMALENGGITREELDGSLTGVYIGAMNDDFNSIAIDDLKLASNLKVTGTQRSIISARVSYTYNLHGPAWTIDTACSSSLVAIHNGSQALRLGECEAAICGGVNCILSPSLFVALSKARMLSPTGQCKAFTDQADGYARAEGCGIVILKRLKDALKDKNEIWGIVKTAVNQDGNMSTPITAPSEKQQVELLEHIFHHYNVRKDQVQVIEAHGTGTSIGDPTEVNALGSFFDTIKSEYKKSIAIGSVKTNIGHLESAAGVAGLIKVLLMLKCKKIVPSLMYSEENKNPKLNFAKFGLTVPTSCQYWKKGLTQRRIACVNSFGFGGTNAHAIVTEFISDQTPLENVRQMDPSLVVLSSDTKESLVRNITSLKVALEQNDTEDVRSIAFTSQLKRDHYKFRKGFPVQSLSELKEKLTDVSEIQLSPAKKKPINFLFCGVSTGWLGMGKEMMTNTTFKNAVNDVDLYLKDHTGWLVSDMFREGFCETGDPVKNHIAIFACQVGLDALWKEIGIKPDAVIGQSVGEVAAAYSAGFMDLRTAVAVIYYRATILADVKNGTMVVVGNIDVHEVETLLNEKRSKVNIAVFNSPKSCTLAGRLDDIQDIRNEISTRFKEAVFHPLDVHCAYHSAHVSEAAEIIEAKIAKVNMTRNTGELVKFFSTVTGKLETNQDVNTGWYWKNNVGMPVKFGEAVKTSVTEEGVIFLEIGPSPVLKAHLRDIFSDTQSNVSSLPSMAKEQEGRTFVATLSSLYELGVNPKWTAVFPVRSRLSTLPSYGFAEKKCPLPKAHTKSKTAADFTAKHLFMVIETDDNGEKLISMRIDSTHTAFVLEHKVKEQPVIPGAMYAEAAFFLGENYFQTSAQNICVSLDFLRAMKMSENTSTRIQCRSRPINESELEFFVQEKTMTICKGTVKRNRTIGLTKRKSIMTDQIEMQIFQGNYKSYNQNEIYSLLQTFGFEYGKSFTLLDSCIASSLEGLVEVVVPESVWKVVNKTTLHPCVLDGALQSCFSGFLSDKTATHFLPAGIESIQVYGQPEREMRVYVKRKHITDTETVYQLHFDVYILNKNDEILVTVTNFTSYIRKEGCKVPVELVYDMRLLPFETKNSSPDGHSKNLVILTDEHNEERLNILKSKKYVKMILPLSQLDISIDKSNTADVIVLMFSDNTYKTGLNSPEEIYKQVRNNCWILTQLIQSLKKSTVDVTLVVTTQNTQHFNSDDRANRLNLFGSEVWGFTRSAQIEHVLKRLTLVDLQTPLKTSLKTFLYYISSQQDKSHPRELVIRDSRIFYQNFYQLPKTTLCPDLRPSLYLKGRKCTEVANGVFLSQNCNPNQDFECIYNDGTCKSTLVERVEMCVQDVFLHPSQLFAESKLADENVLVGIEYTGIKVEALSKASVESEDVILFPAKIQPILNVPAACVTSKILIPNYTPGLLVYGLTFWEMAQQVPLMSTCKVISGSTPFVNLLMRMLFSVRRSKIANTDDGNIDVLILLTKKQKSLKELWHVKRAITFPNILSMTQIKLLDANKCKHIECGFEHVFSQTMTPKNKDSFIAWLQKDKTQLSSYCETEEKPQHIPIARENKLILPCKKYISKLFDEKCIYIVTGGLTGLGWEIVKILLDKGARKIVTLSRREKTTKHSDAIKLLSERYQCTIEHIRTDTSNFLSVQEAIRNISDNIGILKGIFHCAGVSDSKAVINMDFVGLQTVLKPKVLGALNLYFAVKLFGLKLHYFQLVSSISSIIGSPGQSSYGAANSFLDALAVYLRQTGFSCQSVRWGALNLGMVTDSNMGDFFRKRGHLPLSVTEIRSCFDLQLLTDVSGLIFANFDWNIIAKDYFKPQMQASLHTLKTSIEDNITTNIEQIAKEADRFVYKKEKLADADSETQLAALQSLVLSASAEIMRIDENELSLSTNLSEVRFDSMSALTVINIVHDETGFRIPFEEINSDKTIRDLVDYIHANIYPRH